MCGIVGVLSRPDNRPAPDVAELAVRLGAASEAIRAWGTADAGGDPTLTNAVFDCEEIIQALRGFVGLRVLLDHAPRLQAPVRALDEAVSRFEKLLDQRASNLGTARVEAFNALLTRAKDALFTLERDRLGNVDKVRSLSCGSATEGHL
ncbi:MAG: hypothetical protein O7E54_09115, partial [Planctomycetota bacterium]|nr:hypothetical protein [Planctomycetota bacterium]